VSLQVHIQAVCTVSSFSILASTYAVYASCHWRVHWANWCKH